MPREIHPDLLDCLRRPNPYVELVTEITAPDVADVLRRSDQFTGVKRVSVTPANSMTASPRGPLMIASAAVTLADFPNEVAGSFDLNREDPQRRLKGTRFQLASGFKRAVLRSVRVRVGRSSSIRNSDFELQIYRITRTPGIKSKGDPGTPGYTETAWTEYSFAPLLAPAEVIKRTDQAWSADKVTLTFNLTNRALVLDNTPEQAVAPDQVGELPSYYIVVRPVTPPGANGSFQWFVDTTTARTIAGVGTFQRVFWERNNPDTDQWVEQLFSDCPNVKLEIEDYQASTAVVYALDMTRAPKAGTEGRIVFERLLPPDTTAVLELSTAGSGGPWTAVKHGDKVATSQQTYHIRVTLNSDAARRSSPGVTAMGVQWRRVYDVSVESVVDHPTREIEVPWMAASIAEAKLKVLRMGSRDYEDLATELGSTQSPTQLEAEIYLASRHPSITRDKWLRLERMLISNRTPSALAEEFSLISYAARLKRKIPDKRETISTVHTVQAGATAVAVPVTPALVGSDNNGYDGKGYYMRVQQTSVADFPANHLGVIAGNTGTGQLDFAADVLPAALAAGDIVEVHSGIYETAPVSWQNTDPADVWWEILTSLLGIPPERIGVGFLPRGGRPPTVIDRAPGDAGAQAKLKVTMRLTEEEQADELLDQVSFIMGGATLEIDGQICFVQIYPLRSVAGGPVTVPLPNAVKVLDARDFSSPSTSPGLEKRTTVLSAKFGKNHAAANPDAYPERVTTVVDNDAFAWLAKPEIDDLGAGEVPEKVARWFYNTTDSGLQLATDVLDGVVRAGSTGLRVWPLPLTEAHPDLVPGDVVVFATDQYTDYDPATGTELRGWLGVRGVVVRAGGMGRQISVFVPGLTENIASIAGGKSGSLDGVGEPPEQPTASATFNPAGEATINLVGGARTASMRAAVSAVGIPSDAVAESGTLLNAAAGQLTFVAPVTAPGATLYAKVFAYSDSAGDGARSEAATFVFVREGTGTAGQPRAEIQPQVETSLVATLRFTGAIGAGGLGPLSYRYRQDFGGVTGGWSNYAVFPSGGSTYAEHVFAKHSYFVKEVVLQVRDANGVEGQAVTFSLAMRELEGVEGGSTGHGWSEEAERISGRGGPRTPGESYEAGPIYDATGGIPLVDTLTRRVTEDLGAPADGRPMESRYGAQDKALGAGAAGAHGWAGERARLAGAGGAATEPYSAGPIYDATGSTPVYDPVTREIENAKIAASTALERPTGEIGSSVQQPVAGTARPLQRGYQSGFVKHGVAVTFSPVYNSVPALNMYPAPARTFSSGLTGDQRPVMRADSLSASGFTCYANVEAGGTPTARDDEFTSPLTATSAGGTVGPATLADAPAYNHTYRARFKLTIGMSTDPAEPSGSVKVVVAVDVSANAGSTWDERGTIEKTVSRDTSGTTETTFTPLEVDVTQTGLDSTDKIRLRIKEVVITGGATANTTTVEGFDFDPTGEGHGVTYTTQTGATAHSMTPNSDDWIKWEAWEKV